jgi:nuclear pore complex protein Nup160
MAADGKSTPPELLGKGKSNVACIPYTLIDRVLAAAQEGGEKEDAKTQAAAKGLKEDVERRIQGLKALR